MGNLQHYIKKAHPNWAPSLHLGYKSTAPDESRYGRLQQCNARKWSADQDDELRKRTRGEHQEENVTAEDVEQDQDQLQNDKQGDDQNEDLAALTRSDFLLLKSQHAELTSTVATLNSEIAVLRSDNGTLKTENAMLKKEVEKLRNTEEFFKEKENENVLKFYTGT